MRAYWSKHMYRRCALAEENRERERERERDRRRRRRTQPWEGGADARGWGAVSCGSCAGGSCAARSACFGVFFFTLQVFIVIHTQNASFSFRVFAVWQKPLLSLRKKSNRPIALNPFEANQICDLVLPAPILSHAAKLVILALAILQKPILAIEKRRSLSRWPPSKNGFVATRSVSQVRRPSRGPCCAQSDVKTAKAFTSVSMLKRPMLRPERCENR